MSSSKKFTCKGTMGLLEFMPYGDIVSPRFGTGSRFLISVPAKKFKKTYSRNFLKQFLKMIQHFCFYEGFLPSSSSVLPPVLGFCHLAESGITADVLGRALVAEQRIPSLAEW
jgi:hypothetical protein